MPQLLFRFLPDSHGKQQTVVLGHFHTSYHNLAPTPLARLATLGRFAHNVLNVKKPLKYRPKTQMRQVMESGRLNITYCPVLQQRHSFTRTFCPHNIHPSLQFIISARHPLALLLNQDTRTAFMYKVIRVSAQAEKLFRFSASRPPTGLHTHVHTKQLLSYYKVLAI